MDYKTIENMTAEQLFAAAREIGGRNSISSPISENDWKKVHYMNDIAEAKTAETKGWYKEAAMFRSYAKRIGNIDWK